MKFAFKSIVVAAAFVAAGAASAASLTLTTTGPTSSVTDQGWTISDLTGTGTLTFSTRLVGALNAATVKLAEIPDAVLTTTPNAQGKYATASAAAPVASLTGSFDGSTVTVLGVGTTGGARMTAVDDGFATTGGSLEITNITVDLVAKKVFATINGGNGVGVKNNFELWDIGAITGATSFAAVEGVTTSVNGITGLKINQVAFDTFSQAMGLTEDGIAALQRVTDFGSIASTISVKAVSSIPEPSTYALMGMGLLAVGLVSRRRAK